MVAGQLAILAALHVQISNWLIDMGLAEDSTFARLSEENVRYLIRKVLRESNI